jgi:uncharacterized membrane protein
MKKPKHASISAAEPNHADQFGLERLVFFSDAVFAIAITLLALEIRLPAGAEASTDAELYTLLVGIWHKYLGYFISFMVIGVFWMAHHRKFRLIQRYDTRLLMLNLLTLMFVAFIPFPSSLISEYSQRPATIFYALTMICAEFLIVCLWWYASWNNRLIDPALDVRQHRRQFISPIATAFVFLLSIGVAILEVDVAKLVWLLILPVNLIANREK